MALETVTLALDGDIPLAAFADAVGAFNDLISKITGEVASSEVDWSVVQLDVSSTIVTARGRSSEPEDVERVVDTYDDVGRRLASGEPVPHYAQKVTEQLRGLLNGRVVDMRFETAKSDWFVLRHPELGDQEELPAAEWVQGARAVGAVQGRIQTLSSRGGLRFTLYDTIHDKAVSCYLREEQAEMMRGLWGELAVVEGRVQRDPKTGRPLSIRQIRTVRRVDERERRDWRRARGASPKVPETLPAEHAIREVRDAW